MLLLVLAANLVFFHSGSAAEISVVSYNNYWWNVGANNRWSQLYRRISENRADLYGFQECNNVQQVLDGAGIGTYESFQGPNKPAGNPAPLAWNGQVFSKIGGPDSVWVASDQYGNRYMNWVRLRHIASGATVLFANTHGPLGNCGNTLGDNWVNGLASNRQAGDIIIFTGDFNCGTGTQAMRKVLTVVDGGIQHGIDHILTGAASSGSAVNGAPSDHPLVKGTVYTGTSPSPSPSPSDPCQAVWNNDAGGHSCGARIRWLQRNRGLTDGQAKNQVAAEFTGQCGACSSGGGPSPAPSPAQTCQSVWNNDANGYSCGSRIRWLQNYRSMTEDQAKNKVAGEFPSACGACSSMGGSPAPSSCENKHADCGYWTQAGYCTGAHSDTMKYYCPLSCSHCYDLLSTYSFLGVQADSLEQTNTSMILPASPNSDELWDGLVSVGSNTSAPHDDVITTTPSNANVLGVASGCVRKVAKMLLPRLIVVYLLC
jgi:hypothetical protein